MLRSVQAQKLDVLALVAVAIFTLLVVTIVPAEYLVWAWAAVALVTIIVLWAHFGDPLTLVLIWLVITATMSYFLWKHPIPLPGGSTFNITIDRLFVLVILPVVVLRLMVGRMSWRTMPGVVKIALLTLAYFTVSLLIAGFSSIAEVSPHFRLVGGYYFPVIALIVVFLSINDDHQLKKFSWFFFFFGLYLTFTAWAEYFRAWSVVFPPYIADQDLGIHWGRARGPFLVSASLGITLVFCFFNNLYLVGHTRGAVKLMIYLADALMIPAIFFTLTRSVWLAMVVCVIIYLSGNRRLRTRLGAITAWSAAAIVLVTIFWPNLVSRERREGGVTDPYPIFARIGLAKISWDLFKADPIFGVGFGHFRDQAASSAGDPASKYIRFGSQLMEHNNFLSVLTETGIVGLVLYLVVLWLLFKASLRMYRRLSPTGTGWMTRELAVLFWIMLVNYLVDGMFRETSVDPFNNTLFFALGGVILGVDYLLDEKSRVEALTPEC